MHSVRQRSEVAELLPRYRGIIPDWDRFLDACLRPLPTIVRTNTLRITPKDLRGRLLEQGISASQVPWEATLLEVDRPAGNTVEHWLGLLYVQEAVQVLPVIVLDPQPGDSVLDLCAAPGGKATQIAARMEGIGPLVANEPSGRRQQALLANVNRLGLLSASRYAFDSIVSSSMRPARPRERFARSRRFVPARRAGRSLGSLDCRSG
jgi:16S rRNA C967 or C1407 C5-methylase (RsmB/RsmF family)